MKKHFLFIFLSINLLVTSIGSGVLASSRTDALIREDVTERLENIAELKSEIRAFKVQLKTLDIALEEAKKKRSRKKLWSNTKKISDAVTALTILSGAIAAYHFENKINVLKIASFIGGLSSSVAVITGLLADMSTDEAEIISNKIADLKPIIKATEVNLSNEVKLLCGLEPSNQMCK